jgi:hypothetical protein
MLVCSSAQAEKPGKDALPIAVLVVKSDDALDQAEALTKALRTAVDHSKGWSLGALDPSRDSLEFLAVKMNCTSIDAACETRIADVIKADRFIWSTVKFSDETKSLPDESKRVVVGTVHMFVRGKGTSTADVKMSGNQTDGNDDSLIVIAAAVLEKLTGGPPQGGVKVATGGVAGQLYVDGKPIGAVPAEGATYQLVVGDHAVTVKAPGYNDATQQVHVSPLATVDAILTMVPLPKDAPIDGRMVGGFVTLAAGVGLGAVGLWAALDVNSVRNNESYKTYQNQFSPSQNACSEAEAGTRSSGLGAPDPAIIVDLCKRASRGELIQAVTFPLAAVAAGVGGYLLGTSSLGKGSDKKDAKPSAWRIEPVVSPQRQFVTVQLVF